MSGSNVYVAVARTFGRPDAPGAVGLFRRPTDGGDWRHVIQDVEALSILVHPADPDIVYAGTTEGVWRSTDRGASFQPAASPDGRRQIWSLLASGADPDRLYAGASPR